MKAKAFEIAAFSVITIFASGAAHAGIAPVPEPEVAAGLVALGLIGVGYRLVRHRFGR